jgi:uncharacterized protein (TIGR03118 family)
MRAQYGLALGLFLLASPALAAGNAFIIRKLDADEAGKAKVTDSRLINPWGLAQEPGAPVWVSDNNSSLSTLYDRTTGAIESLTVNIKPGNPSGIVYVPSGIDFSVTENGKSGDASFIFDTETGAIEGWSGGVDINNAITVVDNSASHASYKGLALDTGTQQLYAANLGQSRVEVYNTSFQMVNAFTDASLPTGYAPFNVVDINGTLYVSFAMRNKSGQNWVTGEGLGYVDTFDTGGHLLKHLISGGQLNAPWGMTIAPAGFGPFGGDLLVANFGNGWINVFNPKTGAYIDTVWNRSGGDLTIPGLWALDNGPGSDEVSFSAGLGAQKHGLLGIISPAK